MPNLWEILGWLYGGLFALRPQADLIDEVAELVVDGRVLDAGCGTGRLEALLPDKNITAIDISTSMLRTAGRRSSKVARADVANLPFAGVAIFDQVISVNVLYTLPDPNKALEEWGRVLKPGAVLVLVTPVTSALRPLLAEHCRRATWRDNLRLFINLPRIGAWLVVLVIRGLFKSSKFQFNSEDQLVRMIEQSGFEITELSPTYAGIGRLIVAARRSYVGTEVCRSE